MRNHGQISKTFIFCALLLTLFVLHLFKNDVKAEEVGLTATSSEVFNDPLLTFPIPNTWKVVRWNPQDEFLLSLSLIRASDLDASLYGDDEIAISIFRSQPDVSLSAWVEDHSQTEEFTPSKSIIFNAPEIILDNKDGTIPALILKEKIYSEKYIRILFMVGQNIYSFSTPIKAINVHAYSQVIENFISKKTNASLIEKIITYIDSAFDTYSLYIPGLHPRQIKTSPLVTQQLVNQSNTDFKLPWPANISYTLTQGWNGLSHYGTQFYAYDFGLSDGRQVLSAKSGTVIMVKGDSQTCGGADKAGYANYVVIKHDNQTATEYLHLSSVSVQKGDFVFQGFPIGLSGHTGYTRTRDRCAAHLHFQAQTPSPTNWSTQSIPIYFDEYSGLQLQAGNIYTSKNYLSSTACGIDNVVLTHENIYHTTFICNAKKTMYVSNSDIHEAGVELTTDPGGTITFGSGTHIYNMNGEGSFRAGTK